MLPRCPGPTRREDPIPVPTPIDYGNVEALTFDCYGTLIDWEAGLTAAFRPILEAHQATTRRRGRPRAVRPA